MNEPVFSIPLIQRTENGVIPWTICKVLTLEHFPWYRSGRKQRTELRACYSLEALHLRFVCEDRHSTSHVTDLNGPVWTDSCVEFFAAPGLDLREYFNLEVNACGCFLLGWGKTHENRRLIDQRLASRMIIHHSTPGPVKEASRGDRGWSVEVEAPFEVLSQFAGIPARVLPDEEWRVNVYRCGGSIDPQYSCWAPIVSDSPDFHRPEFFGRMRFG